MPNPLHQYLERAKALHLDSFACDWVVDCDSHEEGRDACIDGAIGHLRFVPEADRFAVAVALVDSWVGPLFTPPEERLAREPRPPVDASTASAWPFTVKERNNG